MQSFDEGASGIGDMVAEELVKTKDLKACEHREGGAVSAGDAGSKSVKKDHVVGGGDGKEKTKAPK